MPLDTDDDMFLGALPPYQMGALPPYQMGAAPRRRRPMPLRDRSMGWASPYRPGVQVTDGALLPISFPSFAFVAATGTNSITQTSNPQTPFRGQRISTTVLRSGTSANSVAPLLNSLIVGPKSIILTAPGPALETFSSTAFDTNLILPPTYPGMQYLMTLALSSALAGTDSLTAIVTIIGTAVL